MEEEQFVKINVPQGKKAIYDEATQTIKFIDKEPPKSKSWEEFCKNHPTIQGGEEYYIADNSIIVSVKPGDGLERERYTNKNLLSSWDDALGILALIQLTRLHSEWVGDWIPDWLDSTQPKWIIEYVKEKITINACSHTYRLLHFPTKEMAEEFLRCFKDLIENAEDFI